MLQSVELRLAKALDIRENQVINTIKLIDEGATIPFIARYRKEVTGGLSDIQLRDFFEQLEYMRELDERRDIILNSIKGQGKLTKELEMSINNADNKTTLEDLYLPYKPKRRTRAQIAREAGLEPLALALLNNQNLIPEIEAEKYFNSEAQINDVKTALEGARYILVEFFAQNAELLALLREKLFKESLVNTTLIPGQEEVGVKFTDYFNYAEPVSSIPSHRMLAVLRGEKEHILTLKIVYPEQETYGREINSYEKIIANTFKIVEYTNASNWLFESVRLSFRAKIFISLETELINKLRHMADIEAIKVFANNLHNLLLQAPAGTLTTMGLDPGIRTGVKVAVVDGTGKVLDTATVYPFMPQNKYGEALHKLYGLITQHSVELVSIGNGTASRETEKLVNDLKKQYPELKITSVMVSEAGASVYSASEYASIEFPNLDVSLRGAVSIARRLQDPLAELVKIDPKSIGVGQYQHDVDQMKLAKSLDNVVEICVNSVGVEVNTASIPLLAKVAGLNNTIAANIVAYRDLNGKFVNRNELKKVPRLGDKTFEQCAGFLRINQGNNPLDKSAVHPESYSLVEQISNVLGVKTESLLGNGALLCQISATEFVSDVYGLPTILDVIGELEKPGRDPRGIFKTAKFSECIETIADLVVGMELEGCITNVTNFGAFVDIGVHQDGLVHISQLTNKYISDPSEVVKAGQIVKIKVLEVDVKRKRISLTMKLNVNQSSSKKVNVSSGVMANAFASLKR
ncbi:MAG: RNA-binding transcriptional accessory protein [Burkholderiales bacterium]|nr:RNA-binding transcriptional accessory protein [Burkholderiales bacterium]